MLGVPGVQMDAVDAMQFLTQSADFFIFFFTAPEVHCHNSYVLTQITAGDGEEIG